MESTAVMVKLRRGFGDGYGAVESEGGAAPGGGLVTLVDGHVKVPAGAIERVVGPLDCPEAVRVRARRYARNWNDNRFVDLATDEELRSAMSHAHEPEVYAACRALRERYAAAGAD